MPYKDKEKDKERRRTAYWKDVEKSREYHRQYAEENRERLVEQRRLKHVERKYNLDADTYLAMLIKQDNLCAICNEPETCTNRRGDVRPLCVDHDHETGAVRALLCNSCNAMLGNARDSQERLLAAAEYLKSFEEN